MESKMGQDFSNVRVHNGTKAHNSASAINAKASYTKGNDIVFAKGEYNPGSSDGKHLLAHELVHVVQQGSHKQHQYLMIKEMAPEIYITHGLDELEKYHKWKGNEYPRNYFRILREFSTYRDINGQNLMGNVGKDLYFDYEFWIRAAIRWLFQKYNFLRNPDWGSAIKAYNGGGQEAENYKKRVLGRLTAASTLVVGNE